VKVPPTSTPILAMAISYSNLDESGSAATWSVEAEAHVRAATKLKIEAT
jgi:hypothetical protein